MEILVLQLDRSAALNAMGHAGLVLGGFSCYKYSTTTYTWETDDTKKCQGQYYCPCKLSCWASNVQEFPLAVINHVLMRLTTVDTPRPDCQNTHRPRHKTCYSCLALDLGSSACGLTKATRTSTTTAA